MAAIIAAADGAAGGGGHQDSRSFGPTEEEVQHTQYKSLLRDHGPLIELNCGGTVHVIYEETLSRIPNTLLSNLVKDADVRAKLARDSKGRIFFDRHPQAFFEILVRHRRPPAACPASPPLPSALRRPLGCSAFF